ncbi:MAG: hypothetical protein V4805_05080 [Pseudomonadota bacterium]
MTVHPKPTKEQVREYMRRRIQAHTPPPSREQIKRELGIALNEAQQRCLCKR